MANSTMTKTTLSKKRRGKGEGSIFRLPDGTWCAMVSAGWQNGKRRRVKLCARTYAEARTKLAEALRLKEQGLPISAERQSVAQFLTYWLVNSVKPSVAFRIHDSYHQIVNRHIIPTLGHVPLSKLGPQHVQQLLNAKLAEGLSARTVNYIRAILRRALNQAVKWGLLSRNPATLVDPPRAERHEITVFTPSEARRFLSAIQGHRLEALFTVAVAVGLRLGECLGLRWQDVDLTDAALRVSVQLQRRDGKPVLTEPKTTRARRRIPLPSFAVAALEKHRQQQELERLAFGPGWSQWGLVFVSDVGTPLDERNVRRVLSSILAKAGLPKLRFHDLRHCAATLLLAQGVHARTIMELLGHSTITLTMNTYAHIIPAVQRHAADMMDDLLGVPGSE